VELLLSMVHILDAEREPEVDVPEHRNSVSENGEERDERHREGSQVGFCLCIH
jgi:hypothetical protein